MSGYTSSSNMVVNTDSTICATMSAFAGVITVFLSPRNIDGHVTEALPLKLVFRTGCGLSASQQQPPAVKQRAVNFAEYALLRLIVEIDHDIAAKDEVE